MYSRYLLTSSNGTTGSALSGSTTKESPVAILRASPVSIVIAEIDPLANTYNVLPSGEAPRFVGPAGAFIRFRILPVFSATIAMSENSRDRSGAPPGRCPQSSSGSACPPRFPRAYGILAGRDDDNARPGADARDDQGTAVRKRREAALEGVIDGDALRVRAGLRELQHFHRARFEADIQRAVRAHIQVRRGQQREQGVVVFFPSVVMRSTRNELRHAPRSPRSVAGIHGDGHNVLANRIAERVELVRRDVINP